MNKKFRNILIAVVAVLVIGSCVFMFAISPISKKEDITESQNMEMPEANGITDELTEGLVVEQTFTNTVDNINEVAVVFSRIYYLDEKDVNNTLAIELLDGSNVLAKTEIKSNDIPDQHRVYLNPSSPINGVLGKELTLKIYENSECDTGVSLMVNNDINTKYDFGGSKKKGSICFSVSGE